MPRIANIYITNKRVDSGICILCVNYYNSCLCSMDSISLKGYVMSDAKRRELEYEARRGDIQAARSLEREKHRSLDGDFDHLINKWVSWHGVRDHYRGYLIDVRYAPNWARFYFSIIYNQEDCSTTTNEKKLPASVECPRVLCEVGLLDLGLQLEGLPES